MGLGLVSLLALMQTANPNLSNPSYDSSKAIAGEVASYLMDTGQRELMQDTGDYYVKCWVKNKEIRDEILEYRLCRAHFQHPETKKLTNMWFLRFVSTRPDSTGLITVDYMVSGHPQFCWVVNRGVENVVSSDEECQNIYLSLISLLRTPFKEESEHEN